MFYATFSLPFLFHCRMAGKRRDKKEDKKTRDNNKKKKRKIDYVLFCKLQDEFYHETKNLLLSHSLTHKSCVTHVLVKYFYVVCNVV